MSIPSPEKILHTTENKIGGTIYRVRVIQSDAARETAETKIERLIKGCISEEIKSMETCEFTGKMA
jgi:hypothetical protein